MTHPVIYYFRLDWVQLVSLLALSLLTWWIHQELWIFLWMIRPLLKEKTGENMWYHSKKETLLHPLLLMFIFHIEFLNFIINNVPICSIIIYYTRITNSNLYGEFTALLLNPFSSCLSSIYGYIKNFGYKKVVLLEIQHDLNSPYFESSYEVWILPPRFAEFYIWWLILS